MKVNLDKIRGLYVQALEQKYSDLEETLSPRKAIRVLDDVIQRIELDNETLIEELASNPKYVHAASGKATEKSHISYPPVGDLSKHPDVVYENWLFVKALKGKTDQVRHAFVLGAEEAWDPYKEDTTKLNFEAKIVGSKIGESYVFRMYWPDNTHDPRIGCVVEYALLIPSDEIADKVPKISENPELLIRVFQKVFYHYYDNSKGHLQIYDGPSAVNLKDL